MKLCTEFKDLLFKKKTLIIRAIIDEGYKVARYAKRYFMSIIYRLTIKYVQFPAAQEKLIGSSFCACHLKTENNFVSNPWKIAVKSFEAPANGNEKCNKC